MSTRAAARPPVASAWDLFRSKAEAAGAHVSSVPDEAAAAGLLAAAGSAAAPGAAPSGTASGPAPAAMPARTRSLSARFPRLAARCAPTPESPAPDVVTAAAFGVAETGSVALVEENADRGACLLAERLWVLVAAGELEPTLDAALERVARLAREGAPYVTLMTGPSRTADIERVLTIGVHGPREVRVVVVGEEPPGAAGAGARP